MLSKFRLSALHACAACMPNADGLLSAIVQEERVVENLDI